MWKFQKSDGFILMNFCWMGMKGTIPESHNSQLPSPQESAGPSSSTIAPSHTWREKTLPCGAELSVDSQGCTWPGINPCQTQSNGTQHWGQQGQLWTNNYPSYTSYQPEQERPTTAPWDTDTILTQEEVWVPVSNRLLNTAPDSHSTPIPFKI